MGTKNSKKMLQFTTFPHKKCTVRILGRCCRGNSSASCRSVTDLLGRRPCKTKRSVAVGNEWKAASSG